MTVNIRKINDGRYSREYLIDRLSPGPSTLATVVNGKHAFQTGSFWVAVPDSLDLDRVSKFGAWIPDIDLSATALLASVARRFVANRFCTVLLHDFVHCVSDPSWEEYKFKDRAVTYNSEVYWEIRGPNTPENEIEELISDWKSYFPVSAFFCVPSSSDRKKSLAREDLEDLADSLVGVAVDVFDGDSFLIWWQGDLSTLSPVSS